MVRLSLKFLFYCVFYTGTALWCWHKWRFRPRCQPINRFPPPFDHCWAELRFILLIARTAGVDLPTQIVLADRFVSGGGDPNQMTSGHRTPASRHWPDHKCIEMDG